MESSAPDPVVALAEVSEVDAFSAPELHLTRGMTPIEGSRGFLYRSL